VCVCGVVCVCVCGVCVCGVCVWCVCVWCVWVSGVCVGSMSEILIMCSPGEVVRAGQAGWEEIYIILHPENMCALSCSICNFLPSGRHCSCFDTR